jgi:DNA-binding Lrp family transcriptional regulator
MIDEKDKQILFGLLQDCRQPLSKIAASVKLPQQTVSYRIKKLEKEKVIKKYTVDINYPKLGYSRHSLYLDLKTINANEVNSYLHHITGIDEVSCCYMLHEVSQWKIYISVWTKTIERYDEIQTKILQKFRKHIKNYLSFQSVRSFTYFARRLNTKKPAKVDIKANPENFQVKETDWKIMRILKKDSGKTALEISKELKVNVGTIMNRIKFLKKNDIIARFYPILDMNKIGYREYTFILRVNPSHVKELAKFMEYAQKDPRFVIVIKAVGYVNLYYAFLAESNEELREIREKVDGILGKAILEEYKIEVENMVS